MASRLASEGGIEPSLSGLRQWTSRSTKSNADAKDHTVGASDTFGTGPKNRDIGQTSSGKTQSVQSGRESDIHHHPLNSNIDSLLQAGRSQSRNTNDEMGRDETSAGRKEASSRDHDTESSADEATNIFRRASSSALNYQSTTSYPASTVQSQTTAQQPQSQPAPQSRPRSTKSKPSTHSIRKSGRVAPAQRGDNSGDSNEEDEAGEHQGWWARLISEYGSIELENKGSVARDHLALERTFLAWLRTSLAFASIGIAITQLFRLNVASHSSSNSEKDRFAALRSMGKPLGATFLGISILMLFIGFNRYFESQHWIIRGKFPASRGSIIVVGLVTFSLMVSSLVVVIVVEPGAREK